jgi:uncharacterized protein YbjT (DUF2867 family)
MILVTGATGNVGREVVRALAEAGAPVRALAGRGAVRALAEAGAPVRALARTVGSSDVEWAGGDLNDPASLRPALTGVRSVFLLPGYRDMSGLLAETARAGADHVVLLSSQAAVATDTGNVISEYMIRSETAARESGLAWTFLRPTAFMSNTLRWLPQVRSGDVIRDAFADLPIASIHPADIAAVAARALLTPGHEGRVHTLSGPRALLPADRVRLLGRALGRDLRFEGLSDDEAWTVMSATTPVEYVKAFFGFYRGNTIDETTVHPTVEEITGQPPRTFAQWADEHAEKFR